MVVSQPGFGGQHDPDYPPGYRGWNLLKVDKTSSSMAAPAEQNPHGHWSGTKGLPEGYKVFFTTVSRLLTQIR